MIRIGMGYDLHRLIENRPLMIGGIHIPSSKGEEAHSDGDVLLHAITDAILGAAALGDIGEFFPPAQDKWKNALSADLLSISWKEVQKKGWKLENLDCVLILEKPQFLPHRSAVCKNIALILGVAETQIFVKAKTAEKLGDIGDGNAVAAHAVCLLSK